MSYLHRAFIRIFALITAIILFLPSQAPALAQTATRIIWLHHSVGYGIIDGGGVRPGLTALGYEFYDHGYQGNGLRDADGNDTGTNYGPETDNTDPDGLALIFGEALNNPADNTFSYLMGYDVIMLKSCYPTSNIGSDAQLEADKGYYRTIAARMDQYPNKLLIIVSHPPQVPPATNAAEASRARALNNWLLSGDFQNGHPNVKVFDLFGRLAGSDNTLRPEYRGSVDTGDAHPNGTANAAVGPQLVTFVGQVIRGETPTSSAPAAIKAIAPTKLINTSSPAFQWNASQGATNYQLVVKQGRTVVFNQSYTAAAAACGAACSVSAPAGPTLRDGRYSFTVTPSNSLGSAPASRALAFIVDTTPPQPPVLAKPAAGAVVRKIPYLVVRRPATAKGFRFALDNDADCASPFLASGEQRSTRFKLTSLDLGPVTWCAQARDAAGNWSSWNVSSFVLAPALPAAPRLISPIRGAGYAGGAPTFAWKPVSGSSITYEIEIGTNSRISAPLVTAGPVTDTSWTPGEALPVGVYYWHVRALNVDDEPGKWSSAGKFVITVSP